MPKNARLLLALAAALAGCAETPPPRPAAVIYPLAATAPTAKPPMPAPVAVSPISPLAPSVVRVDPPTPPAIGSSAVAVDGLAGTCRARVCPRWQGAVERTRVQRRSAGQ